MVSTIKKNVNPPPNEKMLNERHCMVTSAHWEHQLNLPWYNRDPVGSIKLKGRWLSTAGFLPELTVTATIKHQEIILTLDAKT